MNRLFHKIIHKSLNNTQNKVLLAGKKLMLEMHLRQSRFT